MKVLQDQYNLIKEGKGNKAHFMKMARYHFPNLVTPVLTYEDTVKVLKNKMILSENIGGLVTKGTTPDWHKIFKENITEVAKAEEKEATKEVTDMETRGYDYKDTKNYDNVFGEEFLKGFYTEMGDEKNKNKDVDELKAIVAKNLAKDINYYVKNGQFGVKGIGYEVEVPGLGTPKEAKGKFKSSGYGDLKESVLRSQIYLLVKEVLAENRGMSLEDAKAEAQRISKEEGVTQHVEETNEGSGVYIVSDWYNGDLTVASYENGRLMENKPEKPKIKQELDEVIDHPQLGKVILINHPEHGELYVSIKKHPKLELGVNAWKKDAIDLDKEFKDRLETGDLDERLRPEDEETFTKATEVAEYLYDLLGNVDNVLSKLPAEYASFKDELEQHLKQKFE